jgi:hypothetical protein
MVSGNSLDPQVTDVLLLNAIDMWDCHRNQQRIKARAYDGVIESNLEVFEHFGAPVVQFDAMVGTEDFKSTKVRYLVRVHDLDELDGQEWGQLNLSAAMPQVPPGFMPQLEEEPKPRPEWN